MAEHTVRFDTRPRPVRVPTGTLLAEAARRADVEIRQPCGGQGRCGRCAVQVMTGRVRPRSVLRLSEADREAGYVLSCQAVIEGDVSVVVPPPERIERRLTTARQAPETTAPLTYHVPRVQVIRRIVVRLPPPTADDQISDWDRVHRALRREAGIDRLYASLDQIRRLGPALRAAEWHVALTVDSGFGEIGAARLIRLQPVSAVVGKPLWGAAVDVGTTTITAWLVDLRTGRVRAQVAEYNRQIARGEDVISRIIYAGKGDGAEELRQLVLESINALLRDAGRRAAIEAEDIVKVAVSGNSTMMHLLLGLPPESIRLAPFVTLVSRPPLLRAEEVGIGIHPEGTVDPLPGVSSYVGADIAAGVLAAGVRSSKDTTLFIDVGTNGEMVLGSSEWLVTCACSAGPAFEGAGVVHGMRADHGAIEEVWVDGETYEPSYRVIGNVKPRGFCGSGLISLVAEMFLTGIVDKGGNLDRTLDSPRLRDDEHGPEYVVAWAEESETGEDLAITGVDIENLLRAKAAIYAGFNVLADRAGVPLEAAERVLIGGSFGAYLNVEKAVTIGLLPDLPWDRFTFLGNTSIQGAYMALLDREARARIAEIASAMAYIELSADNSFYEAFTSALFLPHTDLSRYPSVAAAIA